MSVQRHILIVEDEDQVRYFLTRAVQRAAPDALITQARNGSEALEIFENHGCDLIITDHRMPIMTGLELLEAVRERSVATPVIVISADAAAEEMALGAGATRFFYKPVSLRQMIEVVTALL